MPQDTTDYPRQPGWETLCPGVRVSEGLYEGDGGVVRSSSSGIHIRKGTAEFLTVSNHGFLSSGEVYHPNEFGEKIVDIVDRYPEFDIAMARLTPADSARFTNNIYFTAQTPTRLAGTEDLEWGCFYTVDGMSTGLISSLYSGRSLEKPIRPPNHPAVPALKWRQLKVFEAFGGINPTMQEGVCGAPFVEVETDNVAGVFHLVNGDYAECAAMDDLIAEGYEVV